jgi:hypothetical protein
LRKSRGRRNGTFFHAYEAYSVIVATYAAAESRKVMDGR